MLELRDVQQAHQRQLVTELRLQAEQAKRVELTQEREVAHQLEPKRSRGLGL